MEHDARVYNVETHRNRIKVQQIHNTFSSVSRPCQAATTLTHTHSRPRIHQADFGLTDREIYVQWMCHTQSVHTTKPKREKKNCKKKRKKPSTRRCMDVCVCVCYRIHTHTLAQIHAHRDTKPLRRHTTHVISSKWLSFFLADFLIFFFSIFFLAVILNFILFCVCVCVDVTLCDSMEINHFSNYSIQRRNTRIHTDWHAHKHQPQRRDRSIVLRGKMKLIHKCGRWISEIVQWGHRIYGTDEEIDQIIVVTYLQMLLETDR